MNAKEFLKEKGISNNDFMDSGVADLIETLLTEYQALQLQQTGVMRSNFIDESHEPRVNVNKFDENDYYNGKFLK